MKVDPTLYELGETGDDNNYLAPQSQNENENDVSLDRKVLFIGGPLHGQSIPIQEPLRMVLRVPGIDPHSIARQLLVPVAKPCLELREIEALTGQTYRRPQVIKEDFERKQVLEREYVLQRFTWDKDEFELYVDSRVAPDELFSLIIDAVTAVSR